MTIEAVDFFYLSMPVVDRCRRRQPGCAGGARRGRTASIGWGECEASPLTSIAAYVAPMSHGACKPVERCRCSGKKLDAPADIARIAAAVELECMDLLQAAHTWSGIEMALWDLLGKKRDAPVYELLGYKQAYPKLPYASQLFGDTPAADARRLPRRRASRVSRRQMRLGTVRPRQPRRTIATISQAAREGLGRDGMLLIDAGQILREDVDAAAARIADAGGGRRDLAGGAVPRRRLRRLWRARRSAAGKIKLAGGEASHNFHMARQLIDYGKVGLHPDRLRPHRRHRPGQAGRRLCGRRGRDLCQPHLHVASGALRVAAALTPACRSIGSANIRWRRSRSPGTCARPISRRTPMARSRVPEAPGLGMEIDLRGHEEVSGRRGDRRSAARSCIGRRHWTDWHLGA